MFTCLREAHMRKLLGVVAALAMTASPALATPVTVAPEPATVALMGGGLALLGLFAWKRNGKK